MPHEQEPESVAETGMVRREPQALIVADQQHCRELLRVGSRSFTAASWLLPARLRPPVTAFYAFCRVADDAIDLSDDPVASLADLQRRVDAIYAGTPRPDPVDRAFCRVVHDAQIPRALVDALLEGFAWDLEDCRYETLEQTLAYAARVASVVGVVMTLIMGVREPETLARACDLGAAMQLTNIARDVGEDARLGRLYLPGQWLREEGVDPEQFLADPTASPGVCRAVARLLVEASRLYERSDAGIHKLPRDCRPAMRAASLIYGDIGRVIARRGHDSITGRAHTSTPRKLWLLARAWLGQARRDATAWSEPPLPEFAFLVDAVHSQAASSTPSLALAGAVP